jgi:hypothetical protein
MFKSNLFKFIFLFSFCINSSCSLFKDSDREPILKKNLNDSVKKKVIKSTVKKMNNNLLEPIWVSSTRKWLNSKNASKSDSRNFYFVGPIVISKDKELACFKARNNLYQISMKNYFHYLYEIYDKYLFYNVTNKHQKSVTLKDFLNNEMSLIFLNTLYGIDIHKKYLRKTNNDHSYKCIVMGVILKRKLIESVNRINQKIYLSTIDPLIKKEFKKIFRKSLDYFFIKVQN